jgi:hypothetical protein
MLNSLRVNASGSSRSSAFARSLASAMAEVFDELIFAVSWCCGGCRRNSAAVRCDRQLNLEGPTALAPSPAHETCDMYLCTLDDRYVGSTELTNSRIQFFANRSAIHSNVAQASSFPNRSFDLSKVVCAGSRGRSRLQQSERLPHHKSASSALRHLPLSDLWRSAKNPWRERQAAGGPLFLWWHVESFRPCPCRQPSRRWRVYTVTTESRWAVLRFQQSAVLT